MERPIERRVFARKGLAAAAAGFIALARILLCAFPGDGLALVPGGRAGQAKIDGRWSGEAEIRVDDGTSNRLALIATFKADGDRFTGSIGPSSDTQFAVEDGRIEGRTVTFRAAMPTRVYSFHLSIDDAGRLAGELASVDGHVTGRLSLSRQKPGDGK